jgi:hypothetical protein
VVIQKLHSIGKHSCVVRWKPMLFGLPLAGVAAINRQPGATAAGVNMALHDFIRVA